MLKNISFLKFRGLQYCHFMNYFPFIFYLFCLLEISSPDLLFSEFFSQIVGFLVTTWLYTSIYNVKEFLKLTKTLLRLLACGIDQTSWFTLFSDRYYYSNWLWKTMWIKEIGLFHMHLWGTIKSEKNTTIMLRLQSYETFQLYNLFKKNFAYFLHFKYTSFSIIEPVL